MGRGHFLPTLETLAGDDGEEGHFSWRWYHPQRWSRQGLCHGAVLSFFGMSEGCNSFLWIADLLRTTIKVRSDNPTLIWTKESIEGSIVCFWDVQPISWLFLCGTHHWGAVRHFSDYGTPRLWYMYYDHSTWCILTIANEYTLIKVHACTLTIVNACAMIIALAFTMNTFPACPMIIVNAGTMIIVDTCTMIIVHACFMSIVHARTTIIVHAWTMIVVHACTILIDHASCPTRLMFGEI